MTDKISDELLQVSKQAKLVNPKQEIPVIVTLSGLLNRTELEEHGLRISHVFDLISAVSGTLRPAEIATLAQLKQVKIIELDGEVSIAST